MLRQQLISVIAAGLLFTACGSTSLVANDSTTLDGAVEQDETEGSKAVGEGQQSNPQINPISETDEEVSPETRMLVLENSAAVRESLGFSGSDARALSTDPEALKNLEENGYLLTDREYEQFRLRSQVGQLVAQVLPELSNLEGFAGAELVHQDDGIFRIYISEPASVGLAQEILATVALPHGEAEVVAAGLSERELLDDMDSAISQIGRAGLDDRVYSVSIRTDFGGLVIGIDDVEDRGLLTSLTEAVRVNSPVEFVEEEPGVDEACVTRSNCTDPLKAGIANGREG